MGLQRHRAEVGASQAGSYRQVSSLLAVLLLAAIMVSAGQSAGGAPGRLLSSSGVAAGGIVELNADGSDVVNLTSNTFGQTTNQSDGQYKSDYASVAHNGTTAFASNRGGQGWRIYVMDADGGHLRQVTFSKGAPTNPASGSIADDMYPAISPNGKQVAFVSYRSGYAMHPVVTSTDIFVVNLKSLKLSQLTQTQLDSKGNWSSIHGLAWSPDGSKIAFRGRRMTTDSNGTQSLQDVLGFVPAGGGSESDVLVGDCASGGLVDWSGQNVLYSFGGSVQGCQTTDYRIYNVATKQGSVIPDSALGTLPPISPGTARFSPDGSQIAYTLARGSKVDLTFISTSGTGKHGVVVPLAFGEWLWWAPGAAVPKPAKLTITPAKIVLTRGGKSVQATAEVLDATGHVISRSAGSWAIDNLNAASPTSTSTGLLAAAKTAAPQTTALHATNAGLTGSASITVK